MRETSLAWGNAVGMRDWATAHSTYSDEFQVKCPVSEFAEFAAFANDNATNGIPRGATYVLDGVVIEGDYGWVYSHFVKDGREIYHDEDQYTVDEPAEVVWRDGKWDTIDSPEFLAQERPCSLEPYMGLTINLPLPAGSTIELPNGRIGVTRVVRNATQMVIQENQYNDLPATGNRFYVVSLEVEHYRTGSEPIYVSSWDFELIGDNRQLYDNGCGSTPNRLDAELYPGGIETGNVCFEVSNSDSGFILIYSLSYDQSVFLSME